MAATPPPSPGTKDGSSRPLNTAERAAQVAPRFSRPITVAEKEAQTATPPPKEGFSRSRPLTAAEWAAHIAFPRPPKGGLTRPPTAAGKEAQVAIPATPKVGLTKPLTAAEKQAQMVMPPPKRVFSKPPTVAEKEAQTMMPPPNVGFSKQLTVAGRETANKAPRALILQEVDPSAENPDVLRAIRDKNRAELSFVLDPRRARATSTPGDGEKWYVSCSACHHVSGNLHLLNNLSPVSDRWLRGKNPGQPLQALARGSVNYNQIVLDDVWYIPGSSNIVSVSQLVAQGMRVDDSPNTMSMKRFDGTEAGRARLGLANHFELEFINTSTSNVSEAAWYLVSSAQEHMTGNLELLTDYRPMRPSRAVRTHAGSILQVCGKGSLLNGKLFSIPDISYVPGLDKNIISISQLTDSGFVVDFGPNGCRIIRRHDSQTVGEASYGGEELFRLSSLIVDLLTRQTRAETPV